MLIQPQFFNTPKKEDQRCSVKSTKKKETVNKKAKSMIADSSKNRHPTLN